MSDHSDLATFLKTLDKMLDNVAKIIYNAKCRIRVEQELNKHAEPFQKEFSGPSETDALPSLVGPGQDGPQPHVQGSTREIGRSTQETEKVLLRGGRMETHDGRS